MNQYKTLFEDCVSIEDLQEAFTKFFAIPEIDEFNKAKHRDLSAMSKQLVQYIDHVCHLSGSIEDEDTPKMIIMLRRQQSIYQPKMLIGRRCLQMRMVN